MQGLVRAGDWAVNVPAIADITFTDDKLVVNLTDGRTLVVPLSWYPRLLHASSQERRNWQLLGEGYAIEWPDLKRLP